MTYTIIHVKGPGMKSLIALFLLTFVTLIQAQDSVGYFQLNKFNIPLNNKGVIADVVINGKQSLAAMDSINFLWSGGFIISGKENGSIWTNGVHTAARIEDYLPGQFDKPKDPRGNLYFINKTPAFNSGWNKWRDAVDIGAKFYDGNKDGLYNPVALNSNGMWDINEDCPDFIADKAVWCVYSDSKPASERQFDEIQPQGLEVKQTLFGFSSDTLLSNVVFVRYEITYNPKGLLNAPDKKDSLYFSFSLDPDLGDANEDLIGCDTNTHSGFVYNNSSDRVLKDRRPTFMLDVLQGPPVYIPGETFTDLNSNGIYDAGEPSLTTAYNFKGTYLGIDTVKGAKNLSMTSFSQSNLPDPPIGELDPVKTFYNYCQGLKQVGDTVNPCTWMWGKVVNEDCNNINKFFWYSGDPVMQKGWLNDELTDQRMMANVGPFEISKNQTVTFISAYIVGVGSTDLNSIMQARIIDAAAQRVYNANFNIAGITDIKEVISTLPDNFSLSQNYPNPFNPSTRINFYLPTESNVKLEVYDVLGKLVTTVIDKQMQSGNHVEEVNLSNFNSGVYFYKLQAGGFTDIKKMILLK